MFHGAVVTFKSLEAREWGQSHGFLAWDSCAQFRWGCEPGSPSDIPLYGGGWRVQRMQSILRVPPLPGTRVPARWHTLAGPRRWQIAFCPWFPWWHLFSASGSAQPTSPLWLQAYKCSIIRGLGSISVFQETFCNCVYFQRVCHSFIHAFIKIF